MSILVYVLLVVTLVPSLHRFPSTATSTQTLIIDGARNPELFPQWYVWETLFQSLAASRDLNARLYQQFKLSADEVALVVRETNSFRRLEEALGKRLRAARESGTALRKTEDEIRAATRDINLEYRHRVLESRARIYAGLRPESLEAVLAHIRETVAATTLRLSGRTLEYFQQPW